MQKRLALLSTLVFVLGMPMARAQQGVGKAFGARDPRTCDSRKTPRWGSISADQAKQYFACDNEYHMGPNASGESLVLVTDIKVEVGKGRAFNILTDSYPFAADNHIDPSQTVYPIRGSFTSWTCNKLGDINGAPGKNCTKWEQPKAQGNCFKNSFGDWHCNMTDFGSSSDFLPKYPAPTQP